VSSRPRRDQEGLSLHETLRRALQRDPGESPNDHWEFMFPLGPPNPFPVLFPFLSRMGHSPSDRVLGIVHEDSPELIPDEPSFGPRTPLCAGPRRVGQRPRPMVWAPPRGSSVERVNPNGFPRRMVHCITLCSLQCIGNRFFTPHRSPQRSCRPRAGGWASSRHSCTRPRTPWNSLGSAPRTSLEGKAELGPADILCVFIVIRLFDNYFSIDEI